MAIAFELNGKAVTVTAENDTPLLWVIRDELGLTVPQAELLVQRLAEEYELHCPNRLITWLWIALAGFTMFFLGSFLSQI